MLSLSDWLNFRLCGRRATDYSQAGCTGLFDLAARAWNEGADRRVRAAARALSGGEAVGRADRALSRARARELGFAPGTPVALGGGDSAAGCSARARSRTATGLVAGTTAPLELVLAEPCRSRGRLRSGRHAVPGCSVLEANAGPIGEGFAWLARLLHPTRRGPRSASPPRRPPPRWARPRCSRTSARWSPTTRAWLSRGSLSLSHMTGTQGRPRGEPRALGARGLRVRGAREPRAARARHAAARPRASISRAVSRAARCSRASWPASRARGRARHRGRGHRPRRRAVRGRGAGVYADVREAARARVRAGEPPTPTPLRRAYAQLYQSWSELRAAGEPTTRRSRCATVPGCARGSAAHGAPRAADIGRRRSSRQRSTTRRSLAARVRRRRVRELPRALQLLTGPSLVSALAGRDVLVTEVDVVDAKALEQLPNLRVVAAAAATP